MIFDRTFQIQEVRSLKKLVIEIRRHGDPDKEFGLTLSGIEAAEKLASEIGEFDMALSAQNYRSIRTAMILGKVAEENVISSRVFDDLLESDDVVGRIIEIIGFVFAHAAFTGPDEVRALIATSSNLVSALKFFSDGQKIPEILNELPVVKHLEGTSITLLFGQRYPAQH